ncbi:urease subunit beta [PVC group bacterium]|nr:urease subunit beta [PVC group bacterium]
MRLSPKEIEKLMLHNAGFVAQKRLWRGLKLNYPEAIALIATQILELIREGKTVSALMDQGKRILGTVHVQPEVPSLIHEVQVEGTFPDGVKLVTIHDPICTEEGDLALALYGSGLSLESATVQRHDADARKGPRIIPGELILQKEELVLNEGRDIRVVNVINKGDRPIQVGSHYPFFEVNPSLVFERESAYGYRLNIPSGTAIRFEPGAKKDVELIPIAGEKIIYGGNAWISGKLSEENKKTALERFRDIEN